MGNIYYDENGYKRYRNSNKLVHRHVVEQKLGRKLKPGEEVHHINRDKSDNRRKNLWVFKTRRDHKQIHQLDKDRYGKW
jgi:hypothetical protein